MTQMQITLPEKIMEVLRAEAKQSGITPNVLARIRLCQIKNSSPDATSRSYIVEMENWRDIEAYVKGRGFGNLSIFLNKAAVGYMRKNRLSAARKVEIDGNIKK